MLKHIQLGDEHLAKLLSPADYKNLLALGKLSNRQLSKMDSDSQEKVGNVSVVVNTILTSCFGAWLGFNAFSHHSIGYLFGFCIILLAIFFGTLIGYLTYLLTHFQAKLALKKQKLCNLQQLIIEILNNRRKEKIKLIHNKIKNILIENKYTTKTMNNERELLDVLNHLQLSFKSHLFNFLISKNLERLKKIIAKLQPSDSPKHIPQESNFTSGEFLLNNALTNASYLKILTKVEVTSKQQIPKLNIWLTKNTSSILVGLIPTLLGTFASMFVFLNGFPAFFAGIHITFGFTETQIHFLQNCSILLALSITLYFAYSHIHSNYKAYKRAKQLELSENVIAEKTNYLLQLISQTHHWGRIYHHLLVIQELYSKIIDPIKIRNTGN